MDETNHGGADEMHASPIARRMQKNKEDPEAMLHEALELLNHPEIPHDMRMSHAKQLLIIKHFTSKGLDVPAHLMEDKDGD